MKRKILFVFLAIVVLASACKNKANKKDSESLDNVSLEETKEMISSIPAPNSLEIMEALNDAGAAYIYDITNKAENVENYLTKKQKSIALGVYCADLSYLVIYNQQDVLPDYVKSVYKLTDELEIPSIDVKRIQDNISNQDSLAFLVDNLFAESNKYLNSSEKVDIALYVLSSSWVETVYLIEKIIEFSGNQKPLLKIILENKSNLDKIVDLLETKKEENGFGSMYDNLVSIQSLFNKIIKNPTDTELVEELKTLVRDIRSDLV